MSNDVPVLTRVLRFLTVCVLALPFCGYTALLVLLIEEEKIAEACEERKTETGQCEYRCDYRCECSCDLETKDR